MNPKIVLHDHLDGGVRSVTVIDLADAAGVGLPANDADELTRWFTIGPGMSIEAAWQRFYLVISVLQTEHALHRVAKEAVEDLATDGVVYAELRFAPLGHLAGGLSADQVMAAVTSGLAEGERATGCVARTIVCGIREDHPSQSVDAAELAVAWKGRGVVGFDLAGNEFEFGADSHAEAFAVARSGGLGVTVHAGEMAGPESIATALTAAHPSRIGHGLHLIDDCEVVDDRIAKLGPVASKVHDAGLMLEVCVTSNSCLGTPVVDHPVRMYRDAGFALSVNPDDRAITTTTVANEYELWRSCHGFTNSEFRDVNLQAVEAAFCDEVTKARLRGVVEAGW
ncbi:MAG: adenosine deaminase [bacterium]|nr:adenosine deaminase [bacterium]